MPTEGGDPAGSARAIEAAIEEALAGLPRGEGAGAL